MIDPTTHAISEFSMRSERGQQPGRVDGRGPGRRALVQRQRHDEGDRADRCGDTRDQRVLGRYERGREPGPDHGRGGRQYLVRRQGNDAVDRNDRSDHARDHAVQRRLERRQPAGRHLDGVRRQRLVHRPGRDPGDRASRDGCAGRVGHPSVGDRIGRSRRREDVQRRRLVQLGGTAALAYRVRLRRLPVAARRQPDRRPDRPLVHADDDRRRPSALVHGQGHLSVARGHRLRNECGDGRQGRGRAAHRPRCRGRAESAPVIASPSRWPRSNAASPRTTPSTRACRCTRSSST